MTAALQVFARRVDELARSRLALCRLGTPLARAVEMLAAERTSSLLVVDDAGAIAGILTERDVARRAAFRLNADAPVDLAMTRPVMTVAQDDYLYRAVGRMRRLGLRHMPVVDAAGRPVGMLDLDAALAAASDRLMGQIDRLTHSSSPEGLAETKRAQAELAGELLADNSPAPEIQALVSEINLDIHRRVLDAVLADFASQGWGQPPVPFTLLVMGSGGRGESFLHPDQDNGLILADYPDDRHGAIDAWFIGFAERFNHALDRVGFPLCRGGVMAMNPLWRKTATQWRTQFALWAERKSPAAILFADIFLDFRAVAGPPEPGQELRRFVTEVLRRHTAFVAQICREETSRSVALGFFRRLVRDSSGEHPGRIDLKMRGTMPLIASVRLLALTHGVAETATLARLDGLVAAGALGREEADALATDFSHVTEVLLRQQLADFRVGAPPGNFVDPDTLSRRARDRLVEALRAIDDFRQRARAELTGEVW
ncbi:MAG: CBS domain-containing protein [Proteobacteria bacterium]|nr:CBS domain-containing protein [Pseudomonadota bacterium]